MAKSHRKFMFPSMAPSSPLLILLMLSSFSFAHAFAPQRQPIASPSTGHSALHRSNLSDLSKNNCFVPSLSVPKGQTKQTTHRLQRLHRFNRLHPLHRLNLANSEEYEKSSEEPVQITYPTPTEAASLGIRDWPQQYHSTGWIESVPEGQILTRYVLDGRGRVTVTWVDPYSGELMKGRPKNGGAGRNGKGDRNGRGGGSGGGGGGGGSGKEYDRVRVYPGTLIEVDGDYGGGTTQVAWEIEGEGGMIVLMPNFEEGGKLLAVAAFLVVLVAGLVAVSGGS